MVGEPLPYVERPGIAVGAAKCRRACPKLLHGAWGFSLPSVGIRWLNWEKPGRLPAVQIASLEHRIRPHGGMDGRVLAVLLHEDIGGAVDVEVGGHGRR